MRLKDVIQMRIVIKRAKNLPQRGNNQLSKDVLEERKYVYDNIYEPLLEM